MQSFEGERQFTLPPDQLWPKLRDAEFLITCIPDASPHDGATRDRGVATVHPGFSFMRGSIDVTIEILGGAEPTLLRYSQKSKGIGSSSEVETAVTLTPHEGGTKVNWHADVKSMGGLLKMVPSGLIRGAANKVIEDVWACLCEKLNQAQG